MQRISRKRWVEGIDLSTGIAGRPDLRCVALVEKGEVRLLEVAPIYPTGCGHFALGSPDGAVLYPGSRVQIELGGTIQSREQDYFQATDGSACGLCAGMRVAVLVPSRKNTQRNVVETFLTALQTETEQLQASLDQTPQELYQIAGQTLQLQAEVLTPEALALLKAPYTRPEVLLRFGELLTWLTNQVKTLQTLNQAMTRQGTESETQMQETAK